MNDDKDKLILVTGAGGFIGGHLVGDLLRRGYTRVRAVDIKGCAGWYQVHKAADNWEYWDLRDKSRCEDAMCGPVKDVYNLAADMGGMGYISNHRVECMMSVLINTNLLRHATRRGASVERYLFASSACVYNADKQKDPMVPALKESDAIPAEPERGYGWEKLYSEQMCIECWYECKLKTFIPRFHNVYGPHGTWHGGREKAPAAICRKIIQAIDNGSYEIEAWGDGSQTRSYMYIDDCIEGIRRIMDCDALIGQPVNLGSSQLVSVDGLIKCVASIPPAEIKVNYNHNAPTGVMGRNSDNTYIRAQLGWEPTTDLRAGLTKTYEWIKGEYAKKI